MAYSDTKWWDSDTVAVVTGANKGIGFHTARLLGQQGLKVVVAARDEQRGKTAVAELNKLAPGASFTFCPLDITDASSVSSCAQTLQDQFGSVQVLINNAGLAYKGSTFGADEAANTIAVNLKGTRRFTEAVLPMMSDGGRIVNVCSMAGRLRQISNQEIREGFIHPTDADAIEALADAFVQAIRDNTYKQKGWGSSMYGVSKCAEVSYTFWLAKELKDKGISVNAVCPGWCQTDMSSNSGPKTAAEGADTPVWTALQHPSPTGQFFQERQSFEW